ncbi:MAG: Major facilitator transporter [Polyangiaceae bacterium]|nr:Major facilitator transporter [Polyangiaceae bacterium]
MTTTEAASKARETAAAPPVARRRHPALWVPTLYFAEGLPMITVSVVAALMYKNLGVSNTDIAIYTGSLYVPWSFKFAWAPITEMFKTKKHWVVGTELAMAVTLSCVALSLPMPSFMGLTLAFFWVTGFLSATQDISADGAYMAVTTAKEQSAWVGVQGFCWNAGRIVASGLLVTLTGYLFEQKLGGATGAAAELNAWQYSWMVVMGVLAALMALLGVWHMKMLPQDVRSTETPSGVAEGMKAFGATLTSFFQKPGIGLGLVFILLYRSGEGFIEKIGPLFMLDPIAKGGLGLSNQALGYINGSFGTLGFMLGALLGGVFAAKLTLKRSIVWLALAMNVPHVCYLILASSHAPSHTLVTTLVTIEKFGYGFGSVAHILYMMQQIAPGKYRTAHYAFATSLMGLGLMIPSMMSGAIQEKLGYQHFFAFCLVASVPSVIAAALAPFHVKDDAEPGVAPVGH